MRRFVKCSQSRRARGNPPCLVPCAMCATSLIDDPLSSLCHVLAAHLRAQASSARRGMSASAAAAVGEARADASSCHQAHRKRAADLCVSGHRTAPHRISQYLSTSHRISLHLNSIHLTSSHLISPRHISSLLVASRKMSQLTIRCRSFQICLEHSIPGTVCQCLEMRDRTHLHMRQ